MKSGFCLILLFFIFLCINTNTFAQQSETAKDSISHPKFDPARDAAKDIKTAIKTAGKEKKRIILDIGGEWCIWCKRLDKLFTTNEEIKKFLDEKYIIVKVNFSKENKNEKVLSKYPKVKGYPHLFVLESNGKLLYSQDTGDLENGKDGHDPVKVMDFLKKWSK
jgi:thioredoxin-related protein